jgi:hypothetical protein
VVPPRRTEVGGSQHFINKKIKYVWDAATMMFVKLRSVDDEMKQADFYRMRDTGLGSLDVTDRTQGGGQEQTNLKHLLIYP